MRKTITTFVLLASSLVSYAQSALSMSVEDKLSNNTVSSMCEDALGRIWMATKVGLDRFDGYDVDVFYHDPFDENTIQSNLVNKVYRDLKDNIWICNASGLAMYDSKLDRIVRVKIPLKSVENIIQVTSGRYLLCSQSSSVLYDSVTGKCETFEPDSVPFVFYGAAQWNDCIIFCTSSYSMEFLSFFEDGTWSRKAEPLHFSHSIHGTLFDSDGNILTDAYGKGLWKIDHETLSMSLIRVDGLPAERIECISFDTEGRVWLGTKQGICIYDSRDGTSYPAQAVSPGLLPHESMEIRTFFKDSRSNIWIGTSFDGVICRFSAQKLFSTLALPGPDAGSSEVISLASDPEEGVLWIGTQHSGVYRMGLDDHVPEPVAPIQMASSICIHPSCPSTIFVSSFVDGVYSVGRRSGASHLVFRKPDVSIVYPARDGKLWVGSLSGLYIVDPASGASANPGLFPNDSRQSITALMKDTDGFLWVGCREGLYRCRVNDNCTLINESFPGMSDIMRVQSLLQSADGCIWIGTSDGLISFSDGNLNGFVSEPALKGRSIVGMREGMDGELWITTDYGLLRYDHAEGTCSSFYSSDGLRSNHFSTGSISSCGQTFYVGDRGGVSVFSPRLMSKDSLTVAPFISELSVNNLTVRPGDDTGILEENVAETKSIVIRHNQNAFSFKFACPDYAAGGNDMFWYKMDGFDRDWVRSTNRTATYTNLPKGKYVFRVRSANTSGVICKDEVAMKVRVRPVWYKSTAFLLVLVIVLAFSAAQLLYLMVRRINRKNKGEMEAMKESYEEKLRRAKIKDYVIPGYVPTADEEAFILKFIGGIEENVSDSSLSVESLASFMCMSRCNLHLKVKNLTGRSPIELIKKIRIEKACEMLRHGGLSLADVADRAGFASTSYFCSSFKKATGYTPKEYVSGK